MNPAAETAETLNALPAFQPPATLGEVWGANWSAAGLSAPVGVQEPRHEAVNELLDAYGRASGKSVFDAAADAGMPISSWAYTGGRLTGRLSASEQAELTAVSGVLASRLPDAQARQVEPFLDVDARAAAKAQQREARAAEVNARAFGLTNNAAGWLAGLARGMADPSSIAGVMVGGPESGPVLSMLGREFAVNAGFGAAAHELTAPERRALGVPEGSLLGDALTAGAYGTGLSLFLRGAGWTLRRAFGRDAGPPPAGFTPHESPPAELLRQAGDLSPEDFEAAARHQDRETAIDALAPVQTFEGRADARAAIDAAAARIEAAETGEISAASSEAPKISELGAEGTARPQAPAEAGAVGETAPAEGAAAADAFPGDAGPRAARAPKETPAPAWREPSAGKAPKRPQSLISFLQSRGGVRNESGELRDFIRQFPGLVNNKRGMTLEHAREAAAEAGYFDHFMDTMADTTPAHLVDAIRDSLQGPIYSARDFHEAEAVRGHEAYKQHLSDVRGAVHHIETEMAAAGQPALDAEHLWTAGELMTADREMDWDAAIERAAIMLYERDAEAARARGEAVNEPGSESGGGKGAGDAGGGQGRREPGAVDGARPALRDAGEAGRAAGSSETGEGSGDVAGGLGGQGADPNEPNLAAQRADVERALAAVEDAGEAVTFQAADGATFSAREALGAVDAFKAAARELGACILKFGQ